jgi:TldD protein
MTLTEMYRDRVDQVLKKAARKADYWDVRLGDSRGTVINYRSQVLEELSFPKTFGGSVRMLVRGGWGFVTFQSLDQLADSAKQALAFATLVGKGRSRLASQEPVVTLVPASEEKKEFLTIPTDKKVELLDHYRDLIWQKKTAVIQSTLTYGESLSRMLYLSSDGSAIEQERPRCRAMVVVVAKNGPSIQKYHKNLMWRRFGELAGQDKVVEEAVAVVNKLVDAPPAKGGEFPVIMDSSLAGTFAHEAFGHLSEADNVRADPDLKKIMVLGKRFGNDRITIYDDPTVGEWTPYVYDDEGVKAVKSILLDKGILVGRLHSRETAGVLHEVPNGHGRAQGVGSRPLVRMGNTIIAPGTETKDRLFSGVKKGYYCVSWQAGMTDHENFNFAAAYGYEIEDGKLGKMVRDLKISGNLFQTLGLIEGVSGDSEEEPGFCGKLDQMVPVATTAPHLRIGKAMVLGV